MSCTCRPENRYRYMEKHRIQADRCFLILAAVEKANSEQDRKYTRNDIKPSKSMDQNSIYTRYVIKKI